MSMHVCEGMGLCVRVCVCVCACVCACVCGGRALFVKMSWACAHVVWEKGAGVTRD